MHSSSNKWLTIDTSKSASNYVTIGSPNNSTSNHKFTPKQQNKPEQNLFKSNFMSRYSSQEDLQAYIKVKPALDDFDTSPKSQKDYYTFKKNAFVPRKSNEQSQKGSAIQKDRHPTEKANSNFKPQKRKSNCLVSNSNSQIYPFHQNAPTTKQSLIEMGNRGLNHLKETSSTSHTENVANNLHAVKSEKSIPSFLKNSVLQKKKLHESQLPFLNGITLDHFKIEHRLGEGKFGSVFLAREKSTGFLVALKITEKKRVLSENFLNQFIRQIKIQAFLDHPNIAKVFGFFHDATNFYSIMELGEGGQLYDIIKNGTTLSEESTSFIIGNLLDAINHLHKKKILHRDIKPENIVLVHGNVKLCDFGWAVYKKGELRSTFCGTPLYLSPELLNGERYDEKVDLWAVGILAFELHLGSSPFNIESQEDLLKIITNEIEYPEDCRVSKNFKEFISAVLKKDPKERLNAQKLMDLKFITRYKQLETCEELCQ